MRKIVLLLTLTAICITSVNAQTKKHELELGVGIWSLNEIVNLVSDVIISAIPDATKMSGEHSYGSIHAGYKYRPLERLGVGGVFAFDYAFSDAVLNDYKIGEFYKHHYTLAFETDFIYLNFDKFKMYALGGVGATLELPTYLRQ